MAEPDVQFEEQELVLGLGVQPRAFKSKTRIMIFVAATFLCLTALILYIFVFDHQEASALSETTNSGFAQLPVETQNFIKLHLQK